MQNRWYPYCPSDDESAALALARERGFDTHQDFDGVVRFTNKDKRAIVVSDESGSGVLTSLTAAADVGIYRDTADGWEVVEMLEYATVEEALRAHGR